MMSATQQKPLGNPPTGNRFRSADEVAEAILGDQWLKHTAKRPRADGRGQETQCVVAANAPQLCNRWGDWTEMPTASAPARDGGAIARAHYGFCPQCAQVCAENALTLGPPLRQMITGVASRPAVQRTPAPPTKPHESAHPVKPSDTHGKPTGFKTMLAEMRREVRTWLKGDALPSQTPMAPTLAVCNMAPQLMGTPDVSLAEVLVFRADKFTDHFACDQGLTETGDPWRRMLRRHADPEVSDSALYRNGDAKKDATFKAKNCALHGAAARALAGFRYLVIQHYQRNWPKEWAERLAAAKGNGETKRPTVLGHLCEECGKNGASQQVQVIRQVVGKDGVMQTVVAYKRVCKACKNRLTRGKRAGNMSMRQAEYMALRKDVKPNEGSGLLGQKYKKKKDKGGKKK